MLGQSADGTMVRCPTCHPFWRYDPDLADMTASAIGRERQLEVIKQMRYRLPILRLVRSDELRELTKQFFDAGWHAQDIIFAFDHDPEGNDTGLNRPPGAASSEQVAKWVKRRLETWRNRHAEPLQSYAQMATTIHNDARAKAAVFRIDWDELARRAVPAVQSGGHAVALREIRIAARLARDARAAADRRELERRRQSIEEHRERGAHKQRMLALLDAYIEQMASGQPPHGAAPRSPAVAD